MRPKVPSGSLVKRWEAIDNKLLGELFARGEYGALGVFGTHNGRVDLRGLPLRTAWQALVDADPGTYLNRPVCTDFEFTKVDFSGASLSRLQLHYGSFRDCIFDNASMQEWTAWGTTYENCSFQQTNLRHALLGVRKPEKPAGLYQCVFDRSILRDTSLVYGFARECSFLDVDWRASMIGGEDITDCKFKGLMENLVFSAWRFPTTMEGEATLQPNALRNNDFSAATFKGVTFRRLAVRENGNLLPPDTPDELDDHGGE